MNPIRKMLSMAAIGSVSLTIVACGASGVKGTYSDPGGSMVLEVRSGGQATFTFMGSPAACTYAAEGDKLNLDCKGDAGKIVMTIHDDGSLTGPPGGFMPVLRKSK